MQPRKSQDDLLFPKSSYIESFVKLLFSKFKLEVYVRADCFSFVFCSVHIVSLYQFIQVVDFKVCGEVLINEHSSSAAIDEGFDGLFTWANIDGNKNGILWNICYCYRVNVETRRY
jgi:hypothetical protein